MKSSFGAILIILIPVFFLSACSSTQQAYLQNIDIYFESNVDVALANEDIEQAGVDLIYVKNGERPIATMALAFIENGQYKWLSKDGAMFITQSGRIVRTVGLDRNLLYTSELTTDPLQHPNERIDGTIWSRIIDSEYQDYGADLESKFTMTTDTLLTIQGATFTVKKITEMVDYKSAALGDHHWTNIYWYHQDSGQLLKTFQKTSAKGERVEITYASRAIRLIGAEHE
jgi:hypothetical protein